MNGFEGKQCEIDVDECLSNPCKNGATCNQYVDSYTCTCRLGFSGINCETNDEDCTESSCMYGGTCIDGINSYTCSCKPGLVQNKLSESSNLLKITDCCRYTGSNCQNRINLCDSGPCRNGATCQDHTTHYTCHCPYGFAGKDCSDYVDWCATDPCENQASCYQVKNQYSCTCGPGWTGKVCDVEMVSCQDAALRKGNICGLLTLRHHQRQMFQAFHGHYSATTVHAKQLAILIGVIVRTDIQDRTARRTSTSANLRLVKTVVLAGITLDLTLVNALKVLLVICYC